MPSPLNGFMAPDASPTSTQLGPTTGPTENAIGSLPPLGFVMAVSGEISQ